jgi:hypothetical protein
MLFMKLVPVAIVCALFFLMLPAMALAANNTTATQNLTAVSVSQNATISVPTSLNETLMKIGSFENATVYISGGANATIKGNALAIDMDEASWMEYRDVYLLYRLPPGFASMSFDYDLHVGEKSNVLLLEFVDDLPTIGVKKGGVPDTAVLGLGTWTNMNSWIRGMNGIGGLAAFPQGLRHVEVVANNGMLYLKVDGNTTAYNFYSQKKYLVIHLMVGDENSYMHGTVANLRYQGPPLDSGLPFDGSSGNYSMVIPNVTLSGKDNGSGGGQLGGSGSQKPTPGPTNVESKPPLALNIWLALAAGGGFFIAWAIVYTKYLK